jgi:hypothetical protein
VEVEEFHHQAEIMEMVVEVEVDLENPTQGQFQVVTQHPLWQMQSLYQFQFRPIQLQLEQEVQVLHHQHQQVVQELLVQIQFLVQ